MQIWPVLILIEVPSNLWFHTPHTHAHSGSKFCLLAANVTVTIKAFAHPLTNQLCAHAQTQEESQNYHKM